MKKRYSFKQSSLASYPSILSLPSLGSRLLRGYWKTTIASRSLYVAMGSKAYGELVTNCHDRLVAAHSIRDTVRMCRVKATGLPRLGPVPHNDVVAFPLVETSSSVQKSEFRTLSPGIESCVRRCSPRFARGYFNLVFKSWEQLRPVDSVIKSQGVIRGSPVK